MNFELRVLVMGAKEDNVRNLRWYKIHALGDERRHLWSCDTGCSVAKTASGSGTEIEMGH